MSQGEGNATGPWNSGPQWEVVSDRDEQAALDGGDGQAQTTLTTKQKRAVEQMAARTKSAANADPLTGADLGAGPGAGKMTQSKPAKR
jgi:Mn-containing catalase